MTVAAVRKALCASSVASGGGTPDPATAIRDRHRIGSGCSPGRGGSLIKKDNLWNDDLDVGAGSVNEG